VLKFLLALANSGKPGQNSDSRKMVAVVVAVVILLKHFIVGVPTCQINAEKALILFNWGIYFVLYCISGWFKTDLHVIEDKEEGVDIKPRVEVKRVPDRRRQMILIRWHDARTVRKVRPKHAQQFNTI